jgi:large subunit ribosomal protein L21
MRMFAIIKTGGKQYKVAANDVIKVEKLVGASGDTIEFSDVLMMGEGSSVKVGEPLVSNARVCGTVLDQIRDDKVIIFKKNRRHNYRRKNGHRQYLTVVRITDILAEGQSPAKAKAPAPKAEAKTAEDKPAKEKPVVAKSVEKKPAAAKKAAPKAAKPSPKPAKK